MVEWDAIPFIVIWHSGKLFGLPLSTLCAQPASCVVAEVSPKELLGYWNGRNGALANIVEGFAPPISANVYGEEAAPLRARGGARGRRGAGSAAQRSRATGRKARKALRARC
eukprot:128822-Prymnesium_polylepis.1